MTSAIVHASASGIEFKLHELPTGENVHDAVSGSTIETVEAVGLPLERVYKTLVVKLDGADLVIAVLPIACQLDFKQLARAAGSRRARLADPKEAERETGYQTGTISPLGQRRRLPVFIDESAFALPSIYVSGGRAGLEIELTAEALQIACDGCAARVASPDSRERDGPR
jgi:Cys-tRNA(Pro)/Cys-tRNA(Cys) deacylase